MAQESIEKKIKGQITADFSPLEGVIVTNTFSKSSSVSDEYGSFAIVAKQGDILSFSATNFAFLRKFINKQEFILGNITVNLTAITIELKEVIVNRHPEISAENMGIIPKDQVKLTSAERKLQTAGDFKPIHLLALLGGALPVDPILNAISGRTKMLKKAVTTERKEFLLAKLQNLFEDNYYIEKLKIPEEQIKSFQYYCVEDPDLGKAIKAKNKTMCMFQMISLATIYKQKRVEN